MLKSLKNVVHKGDHIVYLLLIIYGGIRECFLKFTCYRYAPDDGGSCTCMSGASNTVIWVYLPNVVKSIRLTSLNTFNHT